MQKLIAVCAGLVVILGVTCGVLWGQLRTERQQFAEMQEQMAGMQEQMVQMRAKLSAAATSPVLAPASASASVPASGAASASGSASAPQPAPSAAVAGGAPLVVAATIPARAPGATPASMPLPSRPPVPASPPPDVNGPAPGSAEERRNIAISEADEAATGRARIWSDNLSQSGLQLNTAQFQALTAASISEHRRDVEQSLSMQRDSTPPRTPEEAFRIREENLVRGYQVNLRILQMVQPQLTEAQASALRAQFDRGHAGRIANLRAEQDLAQQAGTVPR